MVDDDLVARLAVEQEDVPRRPGEKRDVIVIQIGGSKMCTVADLRESADADLVRRILARWYSGPGAGVSRAPHALNELIPREE